MSEARINREEDKLPEVRRRGFEQAALVLFANCPELQVILRQEFDPPHGIRTLIKSPPFSHVEHVLQEGRLSIHDCRRHRLDPVLLKFLHP
jgi:hypothetical protein